MARMAVPLKIIIWFFSVLFLGLVIFQSPVLPDEVGPYAEFQRSLINWDCLGLFFLQSNIAYVVLLSIFRLRDGYMS